MNLPFRAGTRAELVAAAGNPDHPDIVVAEGIAPLPTLRMAPGQSLRGEGRPVLRFAPDADGVQLTADNAVSGLTLAADPGRRVIFNDIAFPGFGRIELSDLRVSGCVRLLAEHAAAGGHLVVAGLHVAEADARGYDQRPSGYGVEVIPGAFTVWNRQPDSGSLVTADLIGLSAGSPGRPVRGSGIFVAGTPGGGRMVATRLETGEVHSNGGIAPGTPDRISGGVFVVSGAWVDLVKNHGPVTTYGPNDMVLDNWGSVGAWQADAKVSSFGPSAIGFVNFGELRTLRVEAPIETFGVGARGFNVYDGTLDDAEFERIITRGDGAVGIQISRPVGRIAVRRGLETFGGEGDSLVKGVVKRLSAVPLSIKPGGSARRIAIAGGLAARGAGVPTVELDGSVEELNVSGGFAAAPARPEAP